MLVVVPPLPLAACSSPSCCGSGLPDARDAKFSEATAAAVQQAQARLGHLHMSGGGSGVGWGGGGGGGVGGVGGEWVEQSARGQGWAAHCTANSRQQQHSALCAAFALLFALCSARSSHRPAPPTPTWRGMLGATPTARITRGSSDPGGTYSALPLRNGASRACTIRGASGKNSSSRGRAPVWSGCALVTAGRVRGRGSWKSCSTAGTQAECAAGAAAGGQHCAWDPSLLHKWNGLH